MLAGLRGYRSVQRDATVDAFTDQDFHLAAPTRRVISSVRDFF